MLLPQLTYRHQTILVNARTTAGRFAELGKPDKNEKNLLPYIHQIHSAYSSLLATVHTNLGTTTTHQIGKINHQITTANKKRLQKDLRELQEAGRQEKLDGGVQDYTEVKIRLVFALLLSGLLHIGETFFNISAFQVFGDMWLASAALAFALSIALFCWSHALPVFVKREVEKQRKILIVVGGIGIVTVIFTVLGLLRSQMLVLHTQQSVSAVYFVLLNLFVFIASAVVSYFLLPEWEAIKALIQSRKKQHEKRQRQQNYKALTQQEKHLHTQAEQHVKNRILNIGQAYDLERQIHLWYREAVGVFIQENLIRRSDGITPKCFASGVPPLKGIYYLLEQK